MSSYVKSKYDIGFLTPTGTSTGLRIARDKSGMPIYKSYDDEFMAQQISMSVGYGNLPPEKELALIRDTMHGGFGQEWDDNETKYYYTIGADCRFKGTTILGPTATAIAMPALTSPTLANGTMEADSSWTSGARSDTLAHAGTYSWRYGRGTAGDADAYQDIADYYPNATYTLTCYVRVPISAGTLLHAHIILDDGVTTTLSDAVAEADSWTQATVTKTLADTATRLRVILRMTNENGGIAYAYFDDAVLTMSTATGACASMIKFNSVQYFGMGQVLYKLNATGDGFTYVKTFPASITDMEIFGANLYIALGNSSDYFYMNTSEVFTLSTLANNSMKYFCTVKGTADTLWASDTANTLRSTVNPVNGGTAWSDAITVDSSTYNINELISTGNVLYIRKGDKPYYLDSSNNVQVLVQEVEYLSNSDAGIKSSTFLGDVYMPWGDQSLLRYSTYDETSEWLDPSDFTTNDSNFIGEVQATACDERYLFILVDNSNKIEIMAGRYEYDDEGYATWHWHPLQEITLTGANIAYVSDVYKKRLWICSTSSSDSIYYIPLTTKYGYITGDTNYSFATGGYVITSWHHFSFKSDYKAFIKLTLNTSACTANVYWTASYQKLGDSSWTSIGNFTTSPTQTRYIPVDGSSNKPTSRFMRFKFAGTTNAVTSTPVLLSYDCRAILYPSNRRIIECEVLCDDNISLKDGSYEMGQGATIKANIEAARAGTYPVAFYDVGWSGSSDTVYVKFLPTVSSLVNIEKQPGKFERHYYLRLQVVPLI